MKVHDPKEPAVNFGGSFCKGSILVDCDLVSPVKVRIITGGKEWFRKSYFDIMFVDMANSWTAQAPGISGIFRWYISRISFPGASPRNQQPHASDKAEE
jgi:hypothetical protein